MKTRRTTTTTTEQPAKQGPRYVVRTTGRKWLVIDTASKFLPNSVTWTYDYDRAEEIAAELNRAAQNHGGSR